MPLRFAYPDADVPVAQIDTKRGRHPASLRDRAALAPLADDAELIIGSGHATHNLGDFQAHRSDPSGPAEFYARAFQSWLHERLMALDDESILDYERRGPHAARAHQSPEHFLPLSISLGAAGRDRRSERIHEEMAYGVLAMDAYFFEPR